MDSLCKNVSLCRSSERHREHAEMFHPQIFKCGLRHLDSRFTKNNRKWNGKKNKKYYKYVNKAYSSWVTIFKYQTALLKLHRLYCLYYITVWLYISPILLWLSSPITPPPRLSVVHGRGSQSRRIGVRARLYAHESLPEEMLRMRCGCKRRIRHMTHFLDFYVPQITKQTMFFFFSRCYLCYCKCFFFLNPQ